MASRKPLGLYFHIPFCRQKCVYCDFCSLPDSESRMDAYAASLRTFLEPADGYTVDTIYFGGGTPSYFGAQRLTDILNRVFQVFRVSPDAEITLEANPDSAVSLEALQLLRSGGFNRISLGMQSADDRELAGLGRIHTMEQTRRAVETARKSGFENLSLDLIYGLPGQSLERWRKNLEAAVQLEPEHLSCYGLKAEPNTPLYSRRHTLPGDDLQADMYLETVRFLEVHGYGQYEISNFARPGKFSRHNWKYWTLGEYIGYGPGAHSDFQGRRWAWDRNLDSWLSGKFVRSEDSCPSRPERQRERVMLGLRTVHGIAAEDLDGGSAPFLPFLERCAEAGYARSSHGRWVLTPEGFLVSNQIIGGLLQILDSQGGSL